MTWEEYQSTDFYRESHPEHEMRRDPISRKTDLMESYVLDVNEYERRCPYEEDLTPDENGLHYIYVCYSTWNGRISGIISYGGYRECRYAKYEYDLAHLDAEYQWAAVVREQYADEDELDEIINSAREIDIFDVFEAEEYDDY